MTYMLIFNEPPELHARYKDPATAPEAMGAWRAYIGAMVEAELMVSGEGLQSPDTGATVRVRDGRTQVQDGPHPDAKELCGGFVVIRAASMEDALAWAARSPAAEGGSVEVRPVMENPTG